MSAFAFRVLDVRPLEQAAPHLAFRLAVTETTGDTVHAVALRCQLRVEPARRSYSPDEQAGLVDLFGPPSRYGDTLQPFLWAHTTALVQGFTGSTEVELALPVTYDFEVAAAKYLHALRDGEVPLSLQLSGTVFTRGTTGFAVEQLSRSCEAGCRLPVRVWREAVDRWFPGAGWVRLDTAALDALARFRAARGLTSWEATVDALVGVAP